MNNVLDNLQSSFKCCGAKNVHDYDNSTGGGIGPGHYPHSCCSGKPVNQTCTLDEVKNSKAYVRTFI